jgi:plastocyanin
MKQNIMVTLVVVALATGAAGFFAGMKYQQTKGGVRQFGNAGFRGPNGATGPNGRGGFRPVSGTILKADDASITVKLPDGSSKIVLLSDKTQISKSGAATKADLTTGATVAVFGTENTDGSVTAQNVQLNPQQMMRGEGGTPNQSQKSADAKEVVVNGSNFQFSPTAITVKKGEKTRILFKNTGGMHDFVVDELNIRTAVIGSNTEDFVEFTPDKTGSFEFYCSVGNHRAMGMKGTITVQ